MAFAVEMQALSEEPVPEQAAAIGLKLTVPKSDLETL